MTNMVLHAPSYWRTTTSTGAVCMSHTTRQIQLESRAACLKVMRRAAGRTPRTSATSTACCSGARCRRIHATRSMWPAAP